MIARIINAKGIPEHMNDCINVTSVSIDPEQRYAVVETSPGVFVAVKISSLSENMLTGEYVDSCSYSVDLPMLNKIYVYWECIRFGFCKLVLWAPELANENGGSFYRTIKRFYFDWERYKTCYEEICGVPCKKGILTIVR